MIKKLLSEFQLARLAQADHEECLANNGSHHKLTEEEDEWGGDLYNSGIAGLDARIKAEHAMYRWTGSVHAQARIDSYIMPCIMQQQQQQAKSHARLSSAIISTHVLQLLAAEPVPIYSVLQYHTLPDLGDHIRARLLAPKICFATVDHGGSAAQSGAPVCATAHSCSASQQCAARGGCLFGSILSMVIGFILHTHTHISRKPAASHMQIKEAIHNCTLTEFSVICTLILALLLGLYPRGRKCAIFPVRVQLLRRVHSMLTAGYSLENSRRFLQRCMPLVQLAMVEYLHNVLLDFFPVECKSLQVTLQAATHAAILCDQFRDQAICTGAEEWEDVNNVAQGCLEKFHRNLRGVVSALKKRSLHYHRQPSACSSTPATPLGQQQQQQQTPAAVECIKDLLELRVCMSDNLQYLYPSLSQYDLCTISLLHKKINIRCLPSGIAHEQLEAWESTYNTACVQGLTARTLYVCTTCVLAGRQVVLRPKLRYSMARRMYSCVVCHKKHGCSSESGVVVAIDMIGKVVRTDWQGVGKTFVFCIQCSSIHDVPDDTWEYCPFTPVPVQCTPLLIQGQPAVQPSASASRKSCCLCNSRATCCSVETMARMENPQQNLVAYGQASFSFCTMHAPPANLVHSACLIDEVQLMQLAKEMQKNKKPFKRPRLQR